MYDHDIFLFSARRLSSSFPSLLTKLGFSIFHLIFSSENLSFKSSNLNRKHRFKQSSTTMETTDQNETEESKLQPSINLLLEL